MEGLRYCSWAPERLLRDPIVRRMDAEAFGGYCSLLVEQWLDPEGTLPSDDETLALLARMPMKSWRRHRTAILGLFYETEDGRISSEIVSDAKGRAVQRSEAAKAAVEERERRRQERLKGEPKTPSDDDPKMVEGSSKEKEKENVKEKEKEKKPPSSPSGTRKAASSGRRPKALQKGNPENAGTWDKFDLAYPRPSNGRKLERADARLTWDLLVEDGEDMDKIVQGAERYRDWITALDKFEYVAMMTTWLNQRRWEESYHIDPNSEDGKKIAAQKEAILRERRSEHIAKFKTQYEAFLNCLAEEATSTPEYVEAWRKEAEETLEKRRRLGMAGAIRMAEKILNDPEEGHRDRIRRWITDQESKKLLPTFWDWDKTQNAEAFKS